MHRERAVVANGQIDPEGVVFLDKTGAAKGGFGVGVFLELTELDGSGGLADEGQAGGCGRLLWTWRSWLQGALSEVVIDSIDCRTNWPSNAEVAELADAPA